MAAKVRGLDRIGQIWKTVLDAQTSATWRLRIAKPRAYWARRFRLEANDLVPYTELERAFDRLDSNRELDRLMSGRSMTIWAIVYDPIEEKEIVLTIAAFGEWETAMLDMASKLEEWSTRYSDEDDGGEASGVVRLIVFVGKR
jgi:hypothetical protein